MSDDRSRAPLDDLDARLREARERQAQSAGRDPDKNLWGEGLGLGLRIAVEVTAALVVGGVLGFLVDRWAGSGPFGLLVGLALGAGAAFMNVLRAVRGLDAAAGFGGSRRRRGRSAEGDGGGPHDPG